MNTLDRSYFRRRAAEERARARALADSTASTFYHKLADAYERQAAKATG